MGLFGFFRRGSNKVDSLQKQLSELRQSHDHLLQSRNSMLNLNKKYTDQITRPSLASPYMSTDTGAKLPIYPFPLIMIQDMVDNDDSIRIPIESLTREIFKNGIEIIEKWKYKCTNCSKEFQYKPSPEDEIEESKEEIDTFSEKQPDSEEPTASGNSPVESPADSHTSEYGDTTKSIIIRKGYDDKNLVCDECGSKNIRRPDPTHRKVLEDLVKKPVNGNMQSIKDILYQLERDLDVCDNAYLLIMRSYDIDDFSHEIVGTRIVEMLRLDPPQVAMIVDSDGRVGYDDNGNRVYVCPRFEHRNKRLITPHCDICGTRALRAVVEVNSVYSIGIPQPKRVVYGEGEVLWKAGKYKPGLVYGYSPIYAVWSKIMALRGMDEYVRKYFDKMRPPRGMLVIASRNYETFKKSWDALEQKAIEDPYEIWPLLIETDRGGKSMAQWIDFTGSLRELQFIEVRDELRRIIGAMYGVLPLWYGMTPSGWSVKADTPIIIRKNGIIDIIPIASIHSGDPHNIRRLDNQNIEVLDKDGNWTKLKTSIRHRAKRKQIDVLTSNGYVEISEDHSIFKSDGSIVKGSELKEGDLVLSTNYRFNHGTNSLTSEMAWSLGFFLAEGYSGKIKKLGSRISIANTNLDRLLRMKKAFDNFFGVEGKIYFKKSRNPKWKDQHMLDYSHNFIYDWLDRFTYSSYKNIKYNKTKIISNGTTRVKKVPEQILNGDDSIAESFLQGYWEGDGHIEYDTNYECVGTEKTLMSGVYYLLNKIGKTTIDVYRSPDRKSNWDTQIRFRVLKGERRNLKEGEIKKILISEFDGDWYDLETESHSFMGGIGPLALHNSQEGLQVTITNRIVRWGQEVLFEAFMDKISKIVGVDDWDMRLKAGEDTDRLRELQIQGAEIANMESIKRMGFPVERTHQGEWKIGLKPIENNPDTTTGGGNLSSKDPQANKEDEQRFQGDPKAKRPSDVGGKFQGHPGSGPNTSLSEKSRKSKKKQIEGESGILHPSKEAREQKPDYNDPKDLNISDTKDVSA